MGSLKSSKNKIIEGFVFLNSLNLQQNVVCVIKSKRLNYSYTCHFHNDAYSKCFILMHAIMDNLNYNVCQISLLFQNGILIMLLNMRGK